jgi:hypothetical protein
MSKAANKGQIQESGKVKRAASTSTPFNSLPSGPRVMVVFRGLQTFCFNGTSNCEIGIHNNTPASQPHIFRIRSWKRPLGTCDSMTPYPVPSTMAGVEITVDQPDVVNGVYVYQNPTGSFTRTDPAFDKFDFRWTLDLEGSDFYDTVIAPKHPDKLKPSVKIYNGIFYTRSRTNSSFYRSVGNTQDKNLGFIARIIAANIYLTANGTVTLKVDNQTVDVFPRKGDANTVWYQLELRNDCINNTACGYDSSDVFHENVRNDFYLYHQTFDAPGGTRYGLMCTDPQQPTGAGLCPGGPDDVSDPAPCTGIVFGRTTGL